LTHGVTLGKTQPSASSPPRGSPTQIPPPPCTAHWHDPFRGSPHVNCALHSCGRDGRPFGARTEGLPSPRHPPVAQRDNTHPTPVSEGPVAQRFPFSPDGTHGSPTLCAQVRPTAAARAAPGRSPPQPSGPGCMPPSHSPRPIQPLMPLDQWNAGSDACFHLPRGEGV